MNSSLIDQLRATAASLHLWLESLPPAERVEPLTDLRETIVRLDALVKTLRRDTLVALVDENGIDNVASAFDVTPDQLLKVIAAPIRPDR